MLCAAEGPRACEWEPSSKHEVISCLPFVTKWNLCQGDSSVTFPWAVVQRWCWRSWEEIREMRGGLGNELGLCSEEIWFWHSVGLLSRKVVAMRITELYLGRLTKSVPYSLTPGEGARSALRGRLAKISGCESLTWKLKKWYSNGRESCILLKCSKI